MVKGAEFVKGWDRRGFTARRGSRTSSSSFSHHCCLAVDRRVGVDMVCSYGHGERRLWEEDLERERERRRETHRLTLSQPPINCRKLTIFFSRVERKGFDGASIDVLQDNCTLSSLNSILLFNGFRSIFISVALRTIYYYSILSFIILILISPVPRSSYITAFPLRSSIPVFFLPFFHSYPAFSFYFPASSSFLSASRLDRIVFSPSDLPFLRLTLFEVIWTAGHVRLIDPGRPSGHNLCLFHPFLLGSDTFFSNFLCSSYIFYNFLIPVFSIPSLSEINRSRILS